MLDDTDTPEKATLTPRTVEPTPVCTLMSDRSLKLEPGVQTNAIELQNLLLSAAGTIAAGIVMRAMNAERVLASIEKRFTGLDVETEQAIDRVLRDR
jgi:hypothetical protein